MPLQDDHALLDNLRTNKHSVLQFTGPGEKKKTKTVGRLLPNYVDINADLQPQGQDFNPVTH